MKKHIRWVNSLHEIPTSDKVGCCVADEKYAIIHTKTVSGQIKRKEFYDEIKKHKEIK
jgi:hypothetical protein